MTPRASGVARLQRALVVALALLAFAWFVAWQPQRPVLAVAGALAILFIHAWVLAIEFTVMAAVNASDPAPRPAVFQLLGAWWRESVENVRVFGWRQPFAWSREPDRLGASQRGLGIVFIHGFVCNRGLWTPWLRQARDRGYRFVAVNLEPAFGSIDDYVDEVEDAIDRLTQATGRPALLVCHSMGGLVARAWLRRDGDTGRVAHVVTIGTPHAGTWIARFSRVHNGRQMRTDGDWLRQLGVPTPAIAGRFTCWYSNCDNIVFPASTATLPGADNRLLHAAGHVDLAFRDEVIQHTFALAATL